MYDLKKVQQEILKVFNEVVVICEKYDIEYFLICGSTLGAVRHEGFIPWDDDLDIGMTRVNYNKFLKVSGNLLEKDMFFQDFKSDYNIPFYFAKVRKNNTKFVEKYTKSLDMHHGIYIDIFQYDNVPDNLIKRALQRFRVNFWLNLFIAKTLKGTSVPQGNLIGKLKTSIRFVANIVLKPVSKDFLYDRVDRISQMYNDIPTKYMNYVKEPYMIMESKDIANLEEVTFEGRKYLTHANREKYLKMLYGDYMEFPPIESRVGHRPVEVKL